MKIVIICIVLIIGFLVLLYGPIMKRLPASTRTQNLSNMRSINATLLGYYATHKVYPDTLQQLVDEGLLDQKFLELLEGRELYYIKGLYAEDGDKIIFHTAAEDSDNSGSVYALAAYVDGSVEVIRGYEINDILAKQKTSSTFEPKSEDQTDSQQN